MSSNPTKLLILGMGGTIAGLAPNPAHDPLQYTPGQLGVSDLLHSLASHADFDGLELLTEQICNIDSCNLNESLLTELGYRVRQGLEDPEINGIVITHGTDTIEETAIFLHLTCGRLAYESGKVVAITGAMLPANVLNTDGPENLSLALRATTRSVTINGVTHQLKGGIVGAFAHRLIAAKNYAKRSSSELDAPVASSPDLFLSERFDLKPPSKDLPIPTQDQWPWVEVITSHVSAKPVILDFLLAQGVQGLVFAGTGQGNLHQNLLPGLIAAKNLNLPMIRGSRTGAGSIRNNVAMNDEDLGTVPAGDLTVPKARIALQLAINASNLDKSLDWKKFLLQ